ncbi:hypothetical protein [Pandoraea commovens]|uniref:Uncharacterized protein n=1 Tax=Pandoraea commovens TaxID=2508289 RepID=A0A5E4WHB5_9BURK|nr:hypothetical protein [Pandoraea commovens]UVA80760.1 hypothetical protein NTU39_07090 [Pandoraea commovens]VVE23219.1 hypothetical protein PCO31010_03277 [Pandoraea commovens]
MFHTELTISASANMCFPFDAPTSNSTCPMRQDISRDFTALQQVERGALQHRESIRTCEWFTNRLERMQNNIAAFNAALGALTRREDARALRAPDTRDLVLANLISMSSDTQVDSALRELVHAINHRPCGESVQDVCERRFGRSLLRDIQQWFARNEQVYQDRLKHETRRDFVACLVAVGFLGRDHIAAAVRATIHALQAFRWAGTGRDPQNEITQDNQVALRPGADN